MVQANEGRIIKRLYLEEGLSRDAIARQLGVSNALVTKSLKQAGVRLRPQKTPTIITEFVLSRPRSPRIAMDRGEVIVRHQIRLTSALAYAIGWMIGDGYVNRREIDAIVSARERHLIGPLVKGVLERFGRVFVVPRHGAFIIRCNSTVLSRILCTAYGTRYWENVDLILGTPRFAAAFIAGFWDADGGVFHEADGTFRAHLYNSNLLLLDKIADAMQNLYGIESTIYKRKENKESPSSKIHARGDRFDLYVRAKSNAEWARQVSKHMLLPWKKPI